MKPFRRTLYKGVSVPKSFAVIIRRNACFETGADKKEHCKESIPNMIVAGASTTMVSNVISVMEINNKKYKSMLTFDKFCAIM